MQVFTASSISLAELILNKLIDLSAVNTTGPLTKFTTAPSCTAASAKA